MSNKSNPLGWLKASGTPYEVGHAMGVQGRDAVHAQLLPSDIWAEITGPAHEETVARLIDNTQAKFPAIHEELRGLAEGLGLPFRDVFAWNCRGDLLASVPDGCTTILTPGDAIQISHNEDGLTFFRGHCFILEATPEGSTPFHAFCYPGSVAGHTFGWNSAGLAQAVNNLRLTGVTPQIPRMVLGRAVLASATLQAAVDVLTDDPRSGGFHMGLAQVGEPDLLSVEYGGGRSSVRRITTRSGHANHALHLECGGQIITQSSGDRQITVDRLVTQPEQTDLDILRDTSGPGLPIRRDAPDDPDDENTLATGVLRVAPTGIEWRIYAEGDGPATFEGAQQPA
ncbi:C45 family autoproteolytic acyltransferase/hydolase [Thalassorhabdomicrobium marinisediminis]|uniref:C45 family autoproteolytic acyltransferase/hydolase n=1 Tax=Thalassorhabdomicrobium marinisediminis TaxID=2170577 RepID=UPI0024912E46|nr:C45 family peptidase [Thalassorhabdomicrobium marinisediminis]